MSTYDVMVFHIIKNCVKNVYLFPNDIYNCDEEKKIKFTTVH